MLDQTNFLNNREREGEFEDLPRLVWERQRKWGNQGGARCGSCQWC